MGYNSRGVVCEPAYFDVCPGYFGVVSGVGVGVVSGVGVGVVSRVGVGVVSLL